MPVRQPVGALRRAVIASNGKPLARRSRLRLPPQHRYRQLLVNQSCKTVHIYYLECRLTWNISMPLQLSYLLRALHQLGLALRSTDVHHQLVERHCQLVR